MRIPWDDLEILLTVLEGGSFSAAARALQLTQPTISRRIAALEERLGQPLFRRDAEGAHVTEAGARLLPALGQMARWATESRRIADGFESSPAGPVRIAAPPGTSFDLLVPFAASLRSALPDVQLHIVAGVEYADLSRGQADFAIRARPPTRPDLETYLHGRVQLGVFASKAYASKLLGERREGEPVRLERIDWVAWSYPNESLEPNPTLKRLVPNFRPAFACNDYIVQQHAVARGLGAMVLAATRHPDQSDEPLVQIPTSLALPASDFYVVCAKVARFIPRVDAVLRQLAARLGEVEGISLL